MTLKPRETRVIALDSSSEQRVHVVGEGPDGGFLTTTADGRIFWRTTAEGSQELRLSNGKNVRVTAELPERVANPGPYRWSLAVEAYTPGGHETITIPALSGPFPLWDWRDRPEIAGASGIGTYTGTLTVPEEWIGTDKGVQVNLGRVDGTTELHVNGQTVGSRIVSDVDWDITPYVKVGANEVRVVVRTTIRNAVTSHNKTSSRTSSYGLRGPVRVEPFAVVPVHTP